MVVATDQTRKTHFPHQILRARVNEGNNFIFFNVDYVTG